MTVDSLKNGFYNKSYIGKLKFLFKTTKTMKMFDNI